MNLACIVYIGFFLFILSCAAAAAAPAAAAAVLLLLCVRCWRSDAMIDFQARDKPGTFDARRLPTPTTGKGCDNEWAAAF